MLSSILSWAFIGFLLMVLAYYSSRVTADEDNSSFDMGAALIDFNRAFPNEPIRSLHFTVDGSAAFIRTFDNRAGFMRRIKGHFACRMIEPGHFFVEALPNGRGFKMEFTNLPPYRGVFEFGSAREAAEVSLWLLDNYIHPEDRMDGSASPLQSA